MNIVKKDLNECPFCGGTRVSLVTDENSGNYIHCSGCHWTFLPRTSWDVDEMVERYNARTGGTGRETAGEDQEDNIDELLAQCLRFREGTGSNTSLFPLEGR